MSAVELTYRIPNVEALQPIPFRIDSAPLERVFPGTFPVEEKSNWLKTYESLEGSIFKYYNIENEVKFLKEVDKLPEDKKDFYLQENVKRFLGEFVGKVPYATVPYEISEKGLSYAGMFVADSYKKAAELGGPRERAEIQGFDEIESTFKRSHEKRTDSLPTGVWISPPKIADYGFVFVFAPDANGHIKEYILRYPESMNELKKSKQIYSALSPTLTPNTTDEFLICPLFDKSKRDPKVILDSVMGQMGISHTDIQKSHQFENAVNSTLSEWIQSYSSLIKNLVVYEKDSPLYNIGVTMAKKKLLAIYQKAEEIKYGIDAASLNQFTIISTPTEGPLSVEHLSGYVVEMQTQLKELPTTEGGSCPAIQNDADPFSSALPFMDNLTAYKTLAKGTPLEKAYQDAESFPCPNCNAAIPSGKGLEKCPNCHITKQEYAKKVNGPQCD